MLIVFAGLPGVGKTTVARELARQIGAVHVRIDSIEHALRSSGILKGPMDDAGYRVGYAVAEDNLRLGLTVVADSVNPLPITREAWRDVARRAAAPIVEIEVVCTDRLEHRRRVESRSPDVAGDRVPGWREVVERDYRPWEGDRLVIDTARVDLAQSVRQILHSLTRS